MASATILRKQLAKVRRDNLQNKQDAEISIHSYG